MSGMAEVLAEHWIVGLAFTNAESGSLWDCVCGGRVNNMPKHLAAVLSAAGYGLVREAKAEALEEAADWLHGGGEEDREEGSIGLWLRGRAKGVRNGGGTQ